MNTIKAVRKLLHPTKTPIKRCCPTITVLLNARLLLCFKQRPLMHTLASKHWISPTAEEGKLALFNRDVQIENQSQTYNDIFTQDWSLCHQSSTFHSKSPELYSSLKQMRGLREMNTRDKSFAAQPFCHTTCTCLPEAHSCWALCWGAAILLMVCQTQHSWAATGEDSNAAMLYQFFQIWSVFDEIKQSYTVLLLAHESLREKAPQMSTI